MDYGQYSNRSLYCLPRPNQMVSDKIIIKLNIMAYLHNHTKRDYYQFSYKMPEIDIFEQQQITNKNNLCRDWENILYRT